jgi:hypothetical protein
MRTPLTTSTIALTLLACGGTTPASAFVGTWSCVEDVDGGPQEQPFTFTLIENVNGTLSPVQDAVASDAGATETCNWSNWEFTVSGSMATSQTIVCNGPGGVTTSSVDTLTLSGGMLTIVQTATLIRGVNGPGGSVHHLAATCTKS